MLMTWLAGCASYRVGNQSLYRPGIRTVHVPVFESAAFRRNLGERLTEAVIKEIEFRTPYKVVHSPSADSTLHGSVGAVAKSVLAENANDEPRHLENVLNVSVTWVDRAGGVLLYTTPIPIPSIVFNITESADFVPEAGQSTTTAQQEAIDRIAQQVVSQMEIPW